MRVRIRKAIVVLLIIWFSVTCYSSFGRVRKAYFPSVVIGWLGYEPYTGRDVTTILFNLKPTPGEMIMFYKDAHRIVKGELYLLFLLNAIPLSLAGAIFYLLKDEPQNKNNRT